MPYANLEPAVMGWVPASVRSSQSEVRHIAILLFDGFSLLGAGIVAEVFHMANELSSAKARAECTYDVRFLSVDGGNVACSSSVRVWTDGLDARHYGGFDALFVAGGRGADDAAKDDRIIEWLRRVQSKTTVVRYRYTKYWSTSDACLARAKDGWTEVEPRTDGGVILVQAKFGLERGRDAKGC